MEITIEQGRKERKKILQTDEKPQCIYITCKKLKKKKKIPTQPSCSVEYSEDGPLKKEDEMVLNSVDMCKASAEY